MLQDITAAALASCSLREALALILLTLDVSSQRLEQSIWHDTSCMISFGCVSAVGSSPAASRATTPSRIKTAFEEYSRNH